MTLTNIPNTRRRRIQDSLPRESLARRIPDSSPSWAVAFLSPIFLPTLDSLSLLFVPLFVSIFTFYSDIVIFLILTSIIRLASEMITTSPASSAWMSCGCRLMVSTIISLLSTAILPSAPPPLFWVHYEPPRVFSPGRHHLLHTEFPVASGCKNLS